MSERMGKAHSGRLTLNEASYLSLLSPPGNPQKRQRKGLQLPSLPFTSFPIFLLSLQLIFFPVISPNLPFFPPSFFFSPFLSVNHFQYCPFLCLFFPVSPFPFFLLDLPVLFLLLFLLVFLPPTSPLPPPLSK